MTVIVGIGTLKGAWFARSDDRVVWDLDGPHLKGWEVSTLGRAPNGDYLAAIASNWYGAAIHRSTDLTAWDQIVDGPAYPAEVGRSLERIWTFHNADGRLYAGVAEAGLFMSEDAGATWDLVAGLTEHATAAAWGPGLGGLALHRIITDSGDPARMWVAISAVGVFATSDGGASWQLRNGGVTPAAPSDDLDIGYCVHSIVADSEQPDTLWRQDHRGVYRTTDGGMQWSQIHNGIPGSGFGFPIARDPSTGALFLVPLESDEYRMPVDGRLRVYRSLDGGESWHVSGGGLPEHPSHSGVLRDAMDVDGWVDGGIYFGTTGGEVWFSTDVGERWSRLPATFPRITSIEVLDA